MSINLNKVTLIGRMGNDPEIVNTQSGDFVRISVATSSTWRDRDGNKQEKTEWHKVVIFAEPSAKFVRQYVKKGDLVYVEGTLETRKWEKDSGETVYITEVVIRPYSGQIQSVSKDSNRGSRDGSQDDYRDRDSRSSSSSDRRSSAPAPSFSRDIDDDIPF